MTAPGNSALVFTLLAVFLACSGYAAGRLHQRYQMERDREEAYRDGYDTATRSIFSLAARLVAPRRGTRPAPRPVVDGAVIPEPSGLPAAALSAAAAFSDAALADPALSDPAPSDPAAPGLAQSDPSRPGSAFSDPALSGPAVLGPARFDAAVPERAEVSGFAPGSESVESPMFWPELSTPDPSPGTGSPGSAGLLRRSAVPGASPVPSPRRAPVGSEHDASSLGFPVPPRPSSRILGEPAAYGGVVYRPFPDPRLIGNAEPLPADRGSYRIPSPASPASSPNPATHPPSEPAAPYQASAEAAPHHPDMPHHSDASHRPDTLHHPDMPHHSDASRRPDTLHHRDVPHRTDAGPTPDQPETGAASSGRHTVPEELVQAETYRLPPDRVFRAKVPDPTDRPALPEESTTRLWVPKPRQS